MADIEFGCRVFTSGQFICFGTAFYDHNKTYIVVVTDDLLPIDTPIVITFGFCSNPTDFSENEPNIRVWCKQPTTINSIILRDPKLKTDLIEFVRDTPRANIRNEVQ